ncbi:MAG TPA: YncE family protein [Pyrinomonadaceae bacterium]|nr:YncE family protein [Pyrinomonadaceae bacterium]
MHTKKLIAFLSIAVIGHLIFFSYNVPAQTKLKGVSGTLWATNKTLNNVAVFDASTGEVIATIPVGVMPIGIIAARDTGKVYVSNETSGTVSVISKETLSVISTINLGPTTKPHHMNVSSDGQYVFVAEFGTNKIAMIDTATDTFTLITASSSAAARTHACWISESGRLYAANTVANQIAEIDVASGTILQEITVGSNPSEVLVTANEKIAYVSVRGENKVKVVDLELGAVVDEVVVGTQPDTLRLTPDGKTLVVTLRDITAARVSVVNVFKGLSVNTVTITPGVTTGHHWLSQSGRYSFVAVERPGAVAVIDNRTLQVVANYVYPGAQTDSRPHGMFYEPEPLK